MCLSFSEHVDFTNGSHNDGHSPSKRIQNETAGFGYRSVNGDGTIHAGDLMMFFFPQKTKTAHCHFYKLFRIYIPC